MASIWAVILGRYAESEMINMGLGHVSSDDHGGILEVSWKRKMDYWTSPRSAVANVKDLFHLQSWKICPASQEHYANFNTGIVLYEGEIGARPDVPNGIPCSGDQTCQLLLVLEVNPDWESPKLSLLYNWSILSDGQAIHLASALAQTIAYVSTDAEIVPSQVQIVSADHEAQIRRWNDYKLRRPVMKTLNQIIHQLALQEPDRQAVYSWDGALTYQELDHYSSILAFHLREQQVGVGILVPVCFAKSMWAIVAMLAINKAGGAFVPLDPSYPQSRLKAILLQLNSPVGLVSKDQSRLLEGLIDSTLVVSEATFSELPLNNAGLNLLPEVDSETAGYCLFTSGSTGEPKGCLVSQSALASVAEHCHALHLRPGTRSLQFASFSFGVSLIEIWCTLLAGGTVCILSDSDRVNCLANAINTMAVDWSILTPTVLATLQPADVPGLRTIIVAGEPLRKSQINFWAESTHLCQGYGFTEWAGICCVSPRIRSAGDIGLIGSPANARCWLVDPADYNKLAPIAAVAELLVEGPSLAEGYLNSPDKTRVSFVRNPPWIAKKDWPSTGSCFYKTGDLVYYDSNGLLRYVSRKDRQVKINGQRVELAETEYHVAKACPNFRSPVVDSLIPKDGADSAVLVAFIPLSGVKNNELPLFALAEDDFCETAQRAKSILRDKLPDFMVPKIFVPLNWMPLTVTGKIDRRKLREEGEKLRHDEIISLGEPVTAGGREVVKPATRNEHLVHQLIVELLRIKKPELVGMQDDFFSLGGNSVLAMQLVKPARGLGVQLTVQDILKNSKLCEMARVAKTLDKQIMIQPSSFQPFALLTSDSQHELIAAAAHQCRIDPSQVEDIYPCTSLQEGMMALSATRPGAYIAQFVHRLRPHVDKLRFRTAWENVVAANPILRTRIFQVGKKLKMYQAVIREDFRWDDDGEMSEEWDTYMKKRQNHPMLLGDVLVYGTLCQGGPSDGNDLSTFFILTMHHSVCDRWSSKLLMDQLERAYQNTALQINYFRPFVEYLGRCTGAKEYWESQMLGLQAQIFPHLPATDYSPVPTAISHFSLTCQSPVPEGYTMSTVLRLAWSLVIAHYTSINDVAFGITVTGRSAPVQDVAQMAAPTIATVPVRVQLNSSHKISTALSDIQNQAIDMIPFEQIGLQYLRKYGTEVELACKFQSHLIVQPSWNDGSRTLFTTCQSDAAVDGGFGSYALVLTCCMTEGDQLNVKTVYDPNVLEAEEMERILHHFEQITQYVLARPHELLDNVPLLSDFDMQQLRLWNGTDPTACNRCVHEIIEQRSSERPDSMAICAWDGNITYAELNNLSTSLANILSTQGIGQEDLVPICFEKSMWMPVAMLGVLKAGGAFTLLDATQPLQRIKTICGNTDSQIILSSKEHSTLAQKLACIVVVVDAINALSWPKQLQDSTMRHSVSPDKAMYATFTSGSTGKPKGVVIEHRSFATSSLRLNEVYQLTAQSRQLQFASYSFDASIMETLVPLIAGSCLCIPSEFQRNNELVAIAEQMGITHAMITPSLARQVLSVNPRFARTLICTGEPMTASDIAQWSENCKLINGYGPSECSVAATLQPQMGPQSNPRNIGFPIGARCWIVNPSNHDQLLPIGAVGELLIEGPIVGRGYLNEPEKSQAVFIDTPSWLQVVQPGSPLSRSYKTGDLARYNTDGSLHYIGRRDSQIKVRGQRVEMGEIENHLRRCFPEVIDAVVEMIAPKDAKDTQLIVAFLCSPDYAGSHGDGSSSFMAPTEKFQAQVTAGYAQLRVVLPEFMVPNLFIPQRALPKNSSGKTDRRQLRDLTMRCSLSELAKYRPASGEKQKPAAVEERAMQAIWAQVLELPLAEIELDDSFYHLGGDSITAMQVVVQARSVGIYTSLEHILRFRSISRIMAHAQYDANLEAPDASLESENTFPLSPMQQLLLSTGPAAWDQCTESRLLRVTAPIKIQQFEDALVALVSIHSMLRAKFTQNSNGYWQQSIVNDVTTSYRFMTHSLQRKKDLDWILTAARRSSMEDIERGPLFSAHLIDVEKEKFQYLFLVSHCLIVDSISWQIILTDIEKMLQGVKTSMIRMHSTSLPFQTWCQMQAEYSERNPDPATLLPMQLPASHYDDPTDFWGVQSGENSNLSDRVCAETVEIDEQITSRLLRTNKNKEDVLVAVILHSFAEVFGDHDRPLPIVFCEGCGRESWDSNIDLSRTVGCFTSLSPVAIKGTLKGDKTCDVTDFVHHVETARSAMLNKSGWAYFCSQNLDPEGRIVFSHPHPMEILFGYSDFDEPSRRLDSLLNLESRQGRAYFQRHALFDVSAFVLHRRLHVQFTYSGSLQYQDAIHRWIYAFQRTLTNFCDSLSDTGTRLGLSDFALLSITDPELSMLIHETLPAVGVSFENVENMYPSSASQRGMLIASSKDRNNYRGYVTWKIESTTAFALDLARFQQAWRRVVDRHAMLRTIFVATASSEGDMVQVVLRQISPDIITCNDLTGLDGQQKPCWSEGHCWHRFTLCETDQGPIYCRLDISHVLVDRMSIDIIQQDMCLAYEGCLPEAKGPSYSDYVAFEKQRRSDAMNEYWKSYLKGLQPCHFSLRHDFRAKHELLSTDRWGHQYRTISPTGGPTLDEYCRRHDLTAWNIVCLAWALVLQAFTNSDDVCFGYVKAGRDAPVKGIEDLVGPVINLLPFRVRLTDDCTVEYATRRLQAEYLDSLPYQMFPLSEVHRLAGVSNGFLFNTAVDVGRGTLRQSKNAEQTVKFTTMAREDGAEADILLLIDPSADNLIVHMRYKAFILSDSQASTVVATFEKALISILRADKGSSVKAIDLLSDQDSEIIWARNRVLPSAMEACVQEIIQQRCCESPDAPAICAWDGDFTYHELENVSSRLARHLFANGVGPEVIVPLYFDKSCWTAIAMLGVLKAGGAFLLLDPTLPQQRLMYLCNQVNSRLVISSPQYAKASSQLAPEVLVVIVGDDHQSWQAEDAVFQPTVLPKNALYVVFTSGTTGQPKGVVIEHRSYCTAAQHQIPQLQLNKSSRVLQFCSYSFDPSISDHLSTLMAGGCICIPSELERTDPGKLTDAINRLSANFAQLVPSIARLFQPDDLSVIRTLVLLGESKTQIDVNHWAGRLKLIDAYGPAECSVLAVIQPKVSPHTDPHEIGFPVGCVAWVVDANDHKKMLPYGAIGELLIEGPIVGRGYLQNPHTAMASFIDYPPWLVSQRKGQRAQLYKTGDLVRYNINGALSILGRKDTQVKIRGQRIELGEVEAQIQQCLRGEALDVLAEVAVPGGRPRGHPLLVALVRLRNSTPDQPEKFLEDPSDSFSMRMAAVEAKLRRTVPAYLVPGLFLPLARVPRTASEKIDRKSLREAIVGMTLEDLRRHRESAALAWRQSEMSKEEQKLQHIWAEVLHLTPETIHAEDNFFHRGGDSIHAMRVAAMGRATGFNISVADIFAHPILSDLAQAVVGRSHATAGNVHHPPYRPFSLIQLKHPQSLLAELPEGSNLIGPEGVLVDVLPATQGQQLFIDRETLHFWNLIICGPIDITRLQAACTATMSRHSILRTIFRLESNGRLLQLVLGPSQAPFHQYLTEDEPLNFTKSLWQTTSTQMNILTHSLPVSFTLVSRSETEHCFSIQISHAQWDGVSLPFLHRDLAASYNGELLPPTSDFSHYVYHRGLEQDKLGVKFWREYLQGSSIADPFTSTLCAEQHQTVWAFKSIPFPGHLPKKTTIASLVKGACALYLARRTNHTDIVFGHTVSGRSLPIEQIESILGCCLNFIPLRVTLRRTWTVQELLLHVQDQYLRALPYEHIELRDIIQNSTEWPAGSQLNLIVQHQNIQLTTDLPLRGLEVHGSMFSHFKPLDEVWVFTEPHPDRLEIQVCTNSKILSQKQASSLAEELRNILGIFVQSLDKPLSEIVSF